MKLLVISIRDDKTEVFNTPWFKSTLGEATRDFEMGVNDKRTVLSSSPQDFKLYKIGEYDTNTGKLTPEDSPVHIIDAIQCVKKEDPPLSADGNSPL